MSSKEYRKEFQEIGREKNENLRALSLATLLPKVSISMSTRWAIRILKGRESSWNVPDFVATLAHKDVISRVHVQPLIRVMPSPLCDYLDDEIIDDAILSDACCLLRRVEAVAWSEEAIDKLSFVLEALVKENSALLTFWKQIPAYELGITRLYQRLESASKASNSSRKKAQR